MTPAEIVTHVTTHLPGFVPDRPPVPLTGGLMNYVWRVPGINQSVVVKIAPPHIAALPEVALDPARANFEAYCLAAFATHPQLAAVTSPALRPPRLLHFDPTSHILILEDVGQSPDLGLWLKRPREEIEPGREAGECLGSFIGKLHTVTFQDPALRLKLNNVAIQKSRHHGQYLVIGDYLAHAGVTDAAALGARATALGETFMQPGRCMIMGDLWPPSILMTANGMRIIDWEFAHFGQPAQDIAHLVAHLWMFIHRAESTALACFGQAVLDGFLSGYRTATDAIFSDLVGEEGLRQSAIHFGAEILARTVGVYQAGYLYEGLTVAHPLIQGAVACAAAHLRAPESTEIFSSLSA